MRRLDTLFLAILGHLYTARPNIYSSSLTSLLQRGIRRMAGHHQINVKLHYLKFQENPMVLLVQFA